MRPKAYEMSAGFSVGAVMGNSLDLTWPEDF